MKWIYSFVLAGVVSGCAFLKEKSPEEAYSLTGIRPKRLVVLVLDQFPAEAEAPLPGLAALKKHAFLFPNAWVGHLLTSPNISFSVVATGLLPKNLPSEGTSPLPPSYWLQALPGESLHKKIFTNTTLEPLAEKVLEFFESDPNWIGVLVRLSSKDHFSELSKIINFLETSELLSETLLIVTAEQNKTLPQKHYSNPPRSSDSFPDYLKPLLQTSWNTLWEDSTLRFYLKKSSRKSLAEIISQTRKLPGVLEIHQRIPISGRTHYIRSYRAPTFTSESLEWSKTHFPILLQSMAHPQAPDIIAFLDKTPLTHQSLQKIPIWIWAPNLRLNNPVIQSQMKAIQARLVDIPPIIFEMMGLPIPGNLDGSSLGIASLLN